RKQPAARSVRSRSPLSEKTLCPCPPTPPPDRMELAPRYDHHSAEQKWYDLRGTRGVFDPDFGRDASAEAADESYTIMIPPPNVTGQLHVGHALNLTIQDVLTRAARKRGYRALWLPGMDHAGIATQ